MLSPESDPLAGVHCGPLALAANAYWHAASKAALCIRNGAVLNGASQVERLCDIVDAGHPGIRERAHERAAALLPALHRISERHP